MERQNQGWLKRLKEVWGRMTTVQQVGLAGAIVVGLALALYAVIWAQTPDYATLFSGLDEQDAAEVVEQLKELKISYRLSQGGTTIEVPERDVHDVRLEMARQGLPKGKAVGFELFDGGQLGSMGMTDFMQRVNYQRALEGELARTIGSLDPVAAARVHIVVPEPNLFISEEKEPTASVVLQLQPRADLTREQVRAVTNLVSSSVEGLKPGNVTLVDVMGNILAAAGDADTLPSTLQASTRQLEVKRAYERELENRLQAVLDQAVGINRGIVRVNAAFNWDEKQVNSETYAPSGEGTGIVRSQETQEELVGVASLPGGVPGVDANTVPGYPALEEGGEEGSAVRRSTIVNYEISRIQQLVTHAPGDLERLSVAVLLDEGLSPEEATRLETMLQAAAGIDNSRGDTLVVERIPFSEQAPIAETPSLLDLERTSIALTMAKLALLGLGLLLLMRFARSTFRELSRSMTEGYEPYIMEVTDEMEPGSVAKQEQLTEGPPVKETKEPAPVKLPEMPAPLEQDPFRESLSTLAARRPELVADLIQNWLAER